MSTSPEYPLLRAASYEMPSTPKNTAAGINSKESTHHEPTTLPEITHWPSSASGIRRSTSNDSLKAPSSSATQTTDISFTPSDIAAMNETLSQARQNGELPRTTSSPMDARSVVQDFGFLGRLREARGDPSSLAPEHYTHLLVEVTRRIRERDSAFDEEETKREAARRVNSYLRSIEQERFFYDAATSASTPKSCLSSTDSQVDAETFSEEVLSIVEQVADQTLLDAAEPLRVQAKRLKSQVQIHAHNNEAQDDQIGVLGWHNDALGDCIYAFEYGINVLGHQNFTFNQQLSSHMEITRQQAQFVKALQAMIDPQSEMVHMSSENLAILAGIINQLSQVVVNLPQAIDGVVSNAVQQHVQVALQDVMHAQQQAMLSLVHEDTRRRQTVDYDLLASKIAQKLEKSNTVEASRPRLGRRICKTIRRTFGRQ